jgi:hypothetical protein
LQMGLQLQTEPTEPSTCPVELGKNLKLQVPSPQTKLLFTRLLCLMVISLTVILKHSRVSF